MESIAAQMTFCAGSLARTPFRKQVEAAAAAGFDSITAWPNVWRHAMRKDGLSLTDMRSLLDDNGLALTDGDAIRDWVPASTAAVSGPPQKSSTSRQEFFDVVCALGGTTVVAVHITDAELNLDRDIEGFARLCDDAAAHDLRVALEFVGFSNIRDASTAMQIIDGSKRSNAGLVVDIGHHKRGGGTDADLAKVPGEKVFTVQLLDGPTAAPADLSDEAVYHRQMPGAGEFDVPGFVRLLGTMGVRASVGAEVYNASFESRDPVDVARELMASLRTVLAAAGMDTPKPT